MKDTNTLHIASTDFLKNVKSFMGENANLCYQCKKCSVGCPLLPEMDYGPHQIVHALRLGLKDLVLNSRTIWICVACETCTTRCPQGVDIVKIMDASRIFAKENKVTPKIKEVPAFHTSVLTILKYFGRLYEFGVVILLKFRTGQFMRDVKMGLKLIRIGKLSILPDFTMAMKINRLFSKALKMERKSL